MKQELLQMIMPVFGNVKNLKLFIALIVKCIKKILGTQKRGKPRLDLTKVISGIIYYLKTGCQWRCLPTIFGNWRSLYGWYARFSELEIFRMIGEKLIRYSDEKGFLQMQNLLGYGSLILTTSSISQKAKNPRMKNKNCLNRLILTDKKGFPISLILSTGVANDTKFLIPLLDKAKKLVNFPEKYTVHADKGFDSMSNRLEIIQRGGFAEIPVRNMGYRVPYPKTKDSKRPIIEHTFAWINAFKSLKTISTKKLSNLYENSYLAFSLIQSRLFKTIDFKRLIKDA